jgi:hypothetical protein
LGHGNPNRGFRWGFRLGFRFRLRALSLYPAPPSHRPAVGRTSQPAGPAWRGGLGPSQIPGRCDSEPVYLGVHPPRRSCGRAPRARGAVRAGGRLRERLRARAAARCRARAGIDDSESHGRSARARGLAGAPRRTRGRARARVHELLPGRACEGRCRVRGVLLPRPSLPPPSTPPPATSTLVTPCHASHAHFNSPRRRRRNRRRDRRGKRWGFG